MAEHHTAGRGSPEDARPGQVGDKGFRDEGLEDSQADRTRGGR